MTPFLQNSSWKIFDCGVNKHSLGSFLHVKRLNARLVKSGSPAPNVVSQSGTWPSFKYPKPLSEVEKNSPRQPIALPATRPDLPDMFRNLFSRNRAESTTGRFEFGREASTAPLLAPSTLPALPGATCKLKTCRTSYL